MSGVLSRNQEKALVEDVLTIDLSTNFDSIANEVEYQGFNIYKILNHFKKKEPNKLQRDSDVQYLVAFFVYRGTNYRKQIIRSKDNTQLKMGELMKKYGIKTDRIQPGTSMEVITPSRLLQAYAPVVFKMLDKGYGKTIIEDYDDLPRCYQFFGASSLIDKKETFDKFVKWAEEADKIVNGPRADSTMVRRYAEIAQKNSVWIKTIKEYEQTAASTSDVAMSDSGNTRE